MPTFLGQALGAVGGEDKAGTKPVGVMLCTGAGGGSPQPAETLVLG